MVCCRFHSVKQDFVQMLNKWHTSSCRRLSFLSQQHFVLIVNNQHTICCGRLSASQIQHFVYSIQFSIINAHPVADVCLSRDNNRLINAQPIARGSFFHQNNTPVWKAGRLWNSVCVCPSVNNWSKRSFMIFYQCV